VSENSSVVLVTGVGPGTGAAISRRFSLGGYRVAMLARTRERLDALQREIPNARGYRCDVTDETQLDSVIEAVRRDPYEASRIDSFLDASLIFARDSQIYLLALGSGSLSEEIYHRAGDSFAVYMAGIDAILSAGPGFIVGDGRSLAHPQRPLDRRAALRRCRHRTRGSIDRKTRDHQAGCTLSVA
jgi:NAD(P)-dependent dehydrogenase (short-subunit alcohol dehydrogenase family)